MLGLAGCSQQKRHSFMEISAIMRTNVQSLRYFPLFHVLL